MKSLAFWLFAVAFVAAITQQIFSRKPIEGAQALGWMLFNFTVSCITIAMLMVGFCLL